MCQKCHDSSCVPKWRLEVHEFKLQFLQYSTDFVPAVIEPCVDAELSEFPLRMRDWLKNVLVTLYERDEDNNLLTEKQKLRVSGQIYVSVSGPNGECDVI